MDSDKQALNVKNTEDLDRAKAFLTSCLNNINSTIGSLTTDSRHIKNALILWEKTPSIERKEKKCLSHFLAELEGSGFIKKGISRFTSSKSSTSATAQSSIKNLTQKLKEKLACLKSQIRICRGYFKEQTTYYQTMSFFTYDPGLKEVYLLFEDNVTNYTELNLQLLPQLNELEEIANILGANNQQSQPYRSPGQ